MRNTVLLVSCSFNKRESDHTIMLMPLGSASPLSRACARPKRMHGQQQPRRPVHARSAGSIIFKNLPKLTSAEWCAAVPEAKYPFLAVVSSCSLLLRLVVYAVWLDLLLRHDAC